MNDLTGNPLLWVALALSVFTVWMVVAAWRDKRRRLQIQTALFSETNFRRAMENSMLTGMRAMDLESRMSYVNPAFCAMTGFSEAELIGCRPPFPYWPTDHYEENFRLLQQEIQGRSPSGGAEVKVMRKDGTLFDARIYVSPMIDSRGKQTGWMTSMTNITEAKRLRDRLHELESDLGREGRWGTGTGHGGYIFLDLQDDHKAMFHDVLKGFEEFAKLKGYSISFSVDGSVANKIAFKFTVLPSGISVSNDTVHDDLKEYMRRVQSGDIDLSDMPRIVAWEKHEALLLAMRNRIIFLQHTYRAQKNVLDFYERVLREGSPQSAGIVPAQNFYLQTGGDMSARNYTASGSERVIQGDNNEVDQSIHIAESFNKRKQQLDSLDQLITILEQAPAADHAKKAVLNLEKVKDELALEGAPDKSRVKKWLEVARDSMKGLALGKDVVDLASRTFESFNISF
nr:PAS domain S-box protein [Paucibacter sp. PLA-PC-4]